MVSSRLRVLSNWCLESEGNTRTFIKQNTFESSRNISMSVFIKRYRLILTLVICSVLQQSVQAGSVVESYEWYQTKYLMGILVYMSGISSL